MKAAALCAGYAGLEMGLSKVVDIDLAWYCEYEPPSTKNPKPANAAAKVLAHRFPEVQNHGDLTTLDWESVEPVDLLVFGWPCQPFSAAGKRKGAEDERAIWPDIARGIGLLRPRYLFAENVPNVVVRGELARVLTSLAGLGFDAVWTCLRASTVGAPHRRGRFFLTAAHSEGVGWGEGRTESARQLGGSGVAVGGDAAADADCEVFGGFANSPEREAIDRATVDGGGEIALGWPRSGQVAANTDCDGSELEASLRADVDGRVLDWAGYGPAVERWERILGRRAPAPTVLGIRGAQQLSPVFVEWMMGLPEGWVCDVPGLTRNQKLKVLGNGVVPAQAEAAFRHLWPLLADVEAAA